MPEVNQLIESSYENNFDLNFDSIEKNINDKTKLFMLNSPNNPSGKYFDSVNATSWVA